MLYGYVFQAVTPCILVKIDNLLEMCIYFEINVKLDTIFCFKMHVTAYQNIGIQNKMCVTMDFSPHCPGCSPGQLRVEFFRHQDGLLSE